MANAASSKLVTPETGMADSQHLGHVKNELERSESFTVGHSPARPAGSIVEAAFWVVQNSCSDGCLV